MRGSTHSTIPEEMLLYIVQRTCVWTQPTVGWGQRHLHFFCPSCGCRLLPFHAPIVAEMFSGLDLGDLPWVYPPLFLALLLEADASIWDVSKRPWNHHTSSLVFPTRGVHQRTLMGPCFVHKILTGGLAHIHKVHSSQECSSVKLAICAHPHNHSKNETESIPGTPESKF